MVPRALLDASFSSYTNFFQCICLCFKCSKDSRFEVYHSDVGSKQTNHKYGWARSTSNICIPSKIPFIRKCVFLESTDGKGQK